MAISETGRVLGELKTRTGLTWGQLADTIGASSGEYVRQVARGAKPGNNLAGVVSELMARGEVRAAAPRRRTASGAIAKVRAPAATGVTSYRPTETTVRSDGRRMFRGASGRMGWQQTTGGTAKGFRDALTSAGRGQHRVHFRVELRRTRGTIWTDVGMKGGYTPAQVRAGIRKYGSVNEWLASQMGAKGGGSRGGADDIANVEVIAE